MKSHHFSIVVIILCLVLLVAHNLAADTCCVGTTGDIDNDGSSDPNIADLVYLVSYMFQGGPALSCPEEGDVDGNGGIDIADMVYLVTYMFQGGPAPVNCSSGEPDVILPLTIGNVLTSNYTEFNSSGTVTGTGQSTSIVVGDSVINDTTWYQVEDSYDGLDTSLWANFSDGAWSIVDTVTPPEQLMLKYPASVGDSYGFGDITIHVDDIAATVTVPAGTFSCYYYRITAPLVGTIGKVWATPNIGVVKAEEYDLDFITVYLKVRHELVSYDLVE